jgi:phage-related holin
MCLLKLSKVVSNNTQILFYIANEDIVSLLANSIK